MRRRMSYTGGMPALLLLTTLMIAAFAGAAGALEVYLTNYPEVIQRGETFTCDVEIYNSGC